MKLSDLTGIVTDYSPVTLKFQKYQLPGYIKDSEGNELFEAEELLALVIDYSRQAGEWIAVNQREFDEAVQRMYFDYQERNRRIMENEEQVWSFKLTKFFYYLKVILTFGLYGLNNPAPSVELYGDFPMKDVEKMYLFERTLCDFHEAFRQAYNYLRSCGYLHAKSENYVLYIYPSETVLEYVRKYTLPSSFYTKKS
jgi:hypothetical protein